MMSSENQNDLYQRDDAVDDPSEPVEDESLHVTPNDEQCTQKYSDHISPKTGICFTIFGMILYMTDIGSDIYVAVLLYIKGHWKFGAVTTSFIVVPIIIGIVSQLFKADNSGRCRALYWPLLPITL